MRYAVTGATGLVGSHLVAALAAQGHPIVALSRGNRPATPLSGVTYRQVDLTSPQGLEEALEGCAAVVHCAGINRELGSQNYENLHVRATQALLEASQKAKVERFVLISYLRARPDPKSAYLDSKWRAEELVRACPLDFTVLKPGLLYGKGDQLIGNLAQMLRVLPVFAPVGLDNPPVRPVAIEDFVKVLLGALQGRVSRQTVAVVGPESLSMGEVAARIGRAVGRRTLVLPLPVWVHTLLAMVMESSMKVPLVGLAQVRMLSEGMAAPLPDGLCQSLPSDLNPSLVMSQERILAALP